MTSHTEELVQTLGGSSGEYCTMSASLMQQPCRVYERGLRVVVLSAGKGICGCAAIDVTRRKAPTVLRASRGNTEVIRKCKR